MTEETLQRKTLRVGSMCCAAVIVRLPSGDQAIGTAFHVGDGVFLTARHVVDGNEIVEVKLDDNNWLFKDELTVETPTKAELHNVGPVWHLTHESPRLVSGPFFHAQPEIDVSAFVVGGIDQNTPSMPLGHHYDDWIIDRDWLLTTGIVFGYPPIPTSREAIQVAATVEVNAVVDTYRDRYVRFVVSGIPRGGFSGSPVYHEYGFVLGMVIESLERGDAREPGFMTVLSVEPLLELLEQAKLMPSCQKLDDGSAD